MKSKKALFGLTSLLALLGLSSAYALDDYELSIGPELSYITYKEPGIMTDKGWFYGIAGLGLLKPKIATNTKLSVGIEMKIAKGTVDYSSPISGNMNGIDDGLFEARGLVGLEFNIEKNMTLTPYTGFGYRSLTDDSEGMVTDRGDWGYNRWIRYYYFPIGIVYSLNIQNNWKIKTSAEYDWFLRGKVTSYLGYLPGYEDVTNNQKNGYGLRASIEISKKFSSFSISAKPYIRYWNIKNSEITYDRFGNDWIEPKNNSTEIGLGLNLNF